MSESGFNFRNMLILIGIIILLFEGIQERLSSDMKQLQHSDQQMREILHDLMPAASLRAAPSPTFWRDHPEKEEAMKYMLLIQQGDTPTPQTEEWERLSEEEQNLFLYGTDGERIYVRYRNRMGRRRSYTMAFEGIVEWARERAAQVFVRPHWDSGTTYWAGDGDHDAHPGQVPGPHGEALAVRRARPVRQPPDRGRRVRVDVAGQRALRERVGDVGPVPVAHGGRRESRRLARAGRRPMRCDGAAAVHPGVVIRTSWRIHQDPVRLGELSGPGCGDFLELGSKVLDLVGMIAGDLASEGPLHLIGLSIRFDPEKVVVGLQRFWFLNSATLDAGSSRGFLSRSFFFDRDGDGLPDHDGEPDQTYDTWPMHGPSARLAASGASMSNATRRTGRPTARLRGSAATRRWSLLARTYVWRSSRTAAREPLTALT